MFTFGELLTSFSDLLDQFGGLGIFHLLTVEECNAVQTVGPANDLTYWYPSLERMLNDSASFLC